MKYSNSYEAETGKKWDYNMECKHDTDIRFLFWRKNLYLAKKNKLANNWTYTLERLSFMIPKK